MREMDIDECMWKGAEKKTEAQELGLQRTGHSGSGPINKKTV